MRHNKNSFTKGYTTQEEGRIVQPNNLTIAKVYSGNDMADGAIIAAAFNAAVECEDMGFNSEECIINLPQLMSQINVMMTHTEVMLNYYGQKGGVSSHLHADLESITTLINKCKGE